MHMDEHTWWTAPICTYSNTSVTIIRSTPMLGQGEIAVGHPVRPRLITASTGLTDATNLVLSPPRQCRTLGRFKGDRIKQGLPWDPSRASSGSIRHPSGGTIPSMIFSRPEHVHWEGLHSASIFKLTARHFSETTFQPGSYFRKS